mgnify:FL=1
MATKKIDVEKMLTNIDGKNPEQIAKIAKQLGEALVAEQESHSNTIEEKDGIISDLTSENEKLAEQAKNAPKGPSDLGTVKSDGKEYPIRMKKFQITKGDLAGVYSHEDLATNSKLVSYLLEKGSGVLGAAIEKK